MADIGKVEPREITSEMRESYLDYAMSVIVSRALPDVRDGLKPVHRRVLYSMQEMGIRSGSKFQKSAKIVGHTMGNYHPHGDTAIYDSMVRMAQDFSLRYPLVDGQGNFGSMDGDAPAAMRYTEARMDEISTEMLRDIEKETVDWLDNYDATRKEPRVLPANVPQLLLNGSMGIAVGMATSIPPHNLTELINACVHLIKTPKATNEDLAEIVTGPDFPTGGAIYSKKDILHSYTTGKGPVVIRGLAEVVEDEKKMYQVIISEIPYQVNKAKLLLQIAKLVKDKKLEGIRDIRDESDKDGVRIVIDLKKDAYPQKVLNKLWQATDMQKTFHLNMLALVDGIQPQVLSLKAMLEHYLAHRKEVIERRTRYDLKRAEDRAHILEGLAIALDKIDQVIETIKKSETKEDAHVSLRKKFKFSERQADAILHMRLQTLAGLEQKKIQDELKEKKELIAELQALLKSGEKLWGVVQDELEGVKEKYGDARRTKVYKQRVGDISEEDLVPEEEAIITLSRAGYIKRIAPTSWRAQKRGGTGKTGAKLSEEDFIEHMITSSSHDDILFFTSTGKVFKKRAYEIPAASRTAKGRAVVNFLEIGQDETVTAIVPLTHKRKEEGYSFLVMATRNGIIKKTKIGEFDSVRRSGLIAIGLDKGDELGWVRPSRGKDDTLLVSRLGQSIRFKEKDVRPMGRSARGVIGMKLTKDDTITGMDIISGTKKASGAKNLLVVLANGYGKKTDLSKYKTQKRGGKGIRTAKLNKKTGEVVGARALRAGESDLVAISKKGHVIRTPLKDISKQGRATQGVRIMKLKDKDEVASITTL